MSSKGERRMNKTGAIHERQGIDSCGGPDGRLMQMQKDEDCSTPIQSRDLGNQ
jgi:hypothetical protein